ncbi:hypothetical protein ES319_D10G216900v1 [Gossypium barbadense]|uniref:Transmembrane protein n=1 Tax=Gossypium barbadense TaxID=3634 RepID=A0A5J5PTY7_GOSBA|nr:hypothetical protein ES319_D10G216900v1 [Gossypium barbadense]
MLRVLTTVTRSDQIQQGSNCTMAFSGFGIGGLLLMVALAASMVFLPLMLPPLPPPPLVLLFFPVGIMAALMFLAFSPAEVVGNAVASTL